MLKFLPKLLVPIATIAVFTITTVQVKADTTKNTIKKIVVTELEKFDPAEQVPLQGYHLRARKIIVPAGMSIAEHEHKLRPGIVYVESGEIIEYRGTNSQLLKKGDSVIEDASTVHAYKNISDKDCVLIAFDIPVK
jgi:quercetin dioxygenase-like cupin family protein